MALNQVQFKHDPQKLSRALFDSAQWWMGTSILCRVLAFVIGALSIVFAILPVETPFIVAILSILSEIASLQSNRAKNSAETVMRKVELRNGFGWGITKAEMADVLAEIPGRVRKQIPEEGAAEPYYSSTEGTGPKRVLENVRESAWWSKHLARRMFIYSLLGSLFIIVFSIVTLLISISTVRDFDVLSNIGRVVTSSLVLAFSVGLLRMIVGYYRFAELADRVDERATRFLDTGEYSDVDAIKLLHEYEQARALAPSIPTGVYNSMRGKLNELWEQYKSVPTVEHT